ncbi:MAG: hypothetical protein II235_00165, partial [Muribaculaceae bacterium]|nr:hypothetical protein [Muribaculaceae bacterium]
MELSDIKNIISVVIPQSKSEGDKLKKRTVADTFHIGSLSGNRLNSGTLRSQFIVCVKEQDWSSCSKSEQKAMHSDQRVFVQTGDDVWDVYKGGASDAENEDPIRIYTNVQGLKSLLEQERQKLFVCSDSPTVSRQIATVCINNKFIPYLSALRTKPFMLLAGISGTGKSRIVRKLAQATVTKEIQLKYNEKFVSENFDEEKWELHRPENFELIQVKPNWHNSMDVIGYLSNMNGVHYEFTPFVKFIVKAWCNPTIPFFLCLDEMNLAPVEEYFAEFLSAIESRGFENGEYMTDPIIKPFDEFGNGVSVSMINSLNDSLKDAMGSDVENHLRTKGLTLPPNLIVIGTVNMDETTFSFSRKVLDRAMSIEMNEVNYNSFLDDATDDELKAIVEEFGEELNELLVNRHIHAKEVVANLDKASDVIKYLETINNLLEGTPFKLGYRAANEALIYLQSTIDFGMDNFAQAMDNFTLMKILSRIEGDESKLRITDSQADNERLTKAGLSRPDLGDNPTILQALRAIIVN